MKTKTRKKGKIVKTMQSITIVCVLLSCGLVAQAQLNYEGNPLTETIDYTAQESKSSRLNARRDYQLFEIADGRTINLSKLPFTPSAIDPLTIEETKDSSSDNDEDTKYVELLNKPMTEEMIPVDNGSPLMKTNNGFHEIMTIGNISDPAIDIKPPIEDSPKAMPSNSRMESRTETRQLREYPIQSLYVKPYQSLLSQESPYRDHQLSRSNVQPQQSSVMLNLSPYPENQIAQISGLALNQFLNSRTPEESKMALQNYFRSRQTESPGSAQQSMAINDEQTRQANDQPANRRNTFDNEISTNYEVLNYQQRIDNDRALPVDVSTDSMAQIDYIPRSQYQQQPQQLYNPVRSNQLGIQSRRDDFYPGQSMKRSHFYRGPMRPRLNPWNQSRLSSPGSLINHPKGTIFSGQTVSGINEHWKQPIDVIYTKPPGSVGPGPTVFNNPSVYHEDSNKLFPESNYTPLPSQKDIYYSQLYAQSYDPHYYNYIAKTGKIKPWLYGKLGKNEEKSIWWELYSGFKNHGMKNMMNPMFLLGMSIPTLTLMLSALVQKRSTGRSYTDIYNPPEFMERYEPQIRAALSAYENQLMEKTERATGKEFKVDKKSIELMPQELYPESRFLSTLEQIGKNVKIDEKQERRLKKRSIGPAPPGIYPFEAFFLANQELFAQAFLDYDKKLMERIELERKKEKLNNKVTSVESSSPST